jgi:RES domain-containing protein
MAPRARSLAVHLAGPLRARFCRATEEGESDDVLDLEASRRSGGRYNPPGEFGAVYCSDSPELCLAERISNGGSGRMAVVPVEVVLKRVLDLTSTSVREALGVPLEDLVSDGHEVTRRLGVAARASGIEALLAPSARGPGRNLVLFLDALDPSSRVVALTSDRLDAEPPAPTNAE